MIDDDAPMTLADACREVFRDAITPATLKGEAAKGRLVLERIGRKYFVTRNALKEMREQCRVQVRRPASDTVRPLVQGLSEMELARAALAQRLGIAPRPGPPR